jgi:acyl-CoA-binding protein
MHWNVVSVKPVSSSMIAVSFEDGIEGRVRSEPGHLNGVFEALKPFNLFKQARVEDGAVTSPGEIDLAPDAMYRAIKQSGEWVLG